MKKEVQRACGEREPVAVAWDQGTRALWVLLRTLAFTLSEAGATAEFEDG